MDSAPVETGFPGLPPQTWSSRADMMRARAQAVSELEKAASHDWRRLVSGAVSLVLLLAGELVFLGVIGPATDLGWEPAAFVLGVPAIVALIGGGVLGLRTWRKGRRIVSTLVAWEELTDRVAPDGSYIPFDLREVEDADFDEERRHIGRRNWVGFRMRQFTVGRVVRLLIATPLFIGGGVLVVASAWASVEEGELTYSGFLATILSLTAFLYGCVVFGGQQRFANTMTRREFRMRRRNRRIRLEQRERREAWDRKVPGG